MTDNRINNSEQIDYKEKYEKLKDFVRGKWKGDCAECAAIANEIFNRNVAIEKSIEDGRKL